MDVPWRIRSRFAYSPLAPAQHQCRENIRSSCPSKHLLVDFLQDSASTLPYHQKNPQEVPRCSDTCHPWERCRFPLQSAKQEAKVHSEHGHTAIDTFPEGFRCEHHKSANYVGRFEILFVWRLNLDSLGFPIKMNARQTAFAGVRSRSNRRC